MKEKSTFLKWTALFVLVFTLSLPLTARESLAGTMYTVSVSKGYLALRTAKAYDDKNEIGELYTGDTVEVTDTSDSTYWYVYSAKLNKSGYVNRNYLVGGGSSTGGSNYTVSVSKGYLALRTAKAYDDKNEIGELYSGDTVQVQDSSDSTYWYVYSPKLNKSGYVNLSEFRMMYNKMDSRCSVFGYHAPFSFKAGNLNIAKTFHLRHMDCIVFVIFCICLCFSYSGKIFVI